MSEGQPKPGKDELNRVFYTTIKQCGRLSTFYSVILRGLPSGTNIQIKEMAEFGGALYADGTLASWFTDPTKADIVYRMLQEQMSQIHSKVMSNAKASLDAVAIIFAHGILDASVYEYLEVLSLASPESFLPYVGEKKVTVSEIGAQSYDQVLRRKVKEFMEKEVEQRSLLYKLDTLHAITQPTNTQMNPEHKYDRNRLKDFDTARHEIIHGNNWTAYPIDFAKEAFYWNLLNWYFLRLVVEKTGLKLSGEGAMKYWLQQ